MLGHCDIVGNEWADAAVNDGCALNQNCVECFWLKRRLCERVCFLKFEALQHGYLILFRNSGLLCCLRVRMTQ